MSFGVTVGASPAGPRSLAASRSSHFTSDFTAPCRRVATSSSQTNTFARLARSTLSAGPGSIAASTGTAVAPASWMPRKAMGQAG